MKRKFRLNDHRIFLSGPFRSTRDLLMSNFRNLAGKPDKWDQGFHDLLSDNYEFLYGRSKGKRECISSRDFFQCSFFGELLFRSSQRIRGKSKWFDPQIRPLSFKHKQYRGRIVVRVYFHVRGNTYITVINRHFKVIPLKLFYYQTFLKLGIINIHDMNIKKMQ